MLPNIAPDLASWGMRFPHAYDEVFIATGLFNLRQESARQKQLFARWRNQLPSPLRREVEDPVLLAGKSPKTVPFSRLTLTAQLEVLRQPPEESWRQCVPLNPWLNKWRDAAAKEQLRLPAWPRKAQERLSGANFARQFAATLRAKPSRPPSPAASVAAQEEFISRKLTRDNLYPLSWDPET
jgi:hypothetical protein